LPKQRGAGPSPTLRRTLRQAWRRAAGRALVQRVGRDYRRPSKAKNSGREPGGSGRYSAGAGCHGARSHRGTAARAAAAAKDLSNARRTESITP
jgi:hypothetical protein